MMCSQDESGEQRAMHWRHHGILDGPEQREQQSLWAFAPNSLRMACIPSPSSPCKP